MAPLPGSPRSPRSGGTSKPYIPKGKSGFQQPVLILRKTDVAAHAIGQMGDLVRHLTMSPKCQKQRTRSLPGAEFPE